MRNEGTAEYHVVLVQLKNGEVRGAQVTQFEEQLRGRALVFFDGSYRTDDPGPFPFAFTLGCLTGGRA